MHFPQLLDRAIAAEKAASEIYEELARRFPRDKRLRQLWRTLAEDERIHAHKLGTWRQLLAYESSAHWPDVPDLERRLGALELLLEAAGKRARHVETTQDAFDLAVSIEASEIDTIYTLLLQASPLARFPDIEETRRFELGRHHETLYAAMKSRWMFPEEVPGTAPGVSEFEPQSRSHRGGVSLKISEWMKKPVITIKRRDTVLHARQIMIEYRINQLPVVEASQVVGIVTDRDVRDAFPSVFDVDPRKRSREQLLGSPDAIPVEEVMSSGVFLFSPEDTVEEAVRILRRERIGSVPIVSEGKLVGILTRSDILAAFLALMKMPNTESAALPSEAAQ